MATRITVTATAVGSDSSKYRLLVDGQVVGEARVEAGRTTTLDFDVAGLGLDVGHEIAVQHYHDTSRRGLAVESIRIDGAALDLDGGYQDVGARDGKTIWTGDRALGIDYNGTFVVDAPAALFGGGTGGGETDGGSVEPPRVEPPAEGPNGDGKNDGGVTLALKAHAAAGSDFAKLKLLVDGVLVERAKVDPGGDTLTFTLDGWDEGPHEIAIQHYHDTSGRALTVDGLWLNDRALDLDGGYQDVGARDGKTIWTGESATTITYNGTFVLDVAGGTGERDGPQAPPASDGPLDLLILGDSIAVPWAKFVAKEDTLPSQLDDRLAASAYDVEIVSLSKSGSKTSDGLARLRQFFGDPANETPDAAIVALGTNDSRKERPIEDVREDLDAILDLLDAHGVEALLVGSYGDWPLTGQGYDDPADVAAFEALFPALAEEHGALLDPYLLAGVLDDPERYTVDDLHPNAAGNALIVDRLMPKIENLLDLADDVLIG